MWASNWQTTADITDNLHRESVPPSCLPSLHPIPCFVGHFDMSAQQNKYIWESRKGVGPFSIRKSWDKGVKTFGDVTTSDDQNPHVVLAPRWGFCHLIHLWLKHVNHFILWLTCFNVAVNVTYFQDCWDFPCCQLVIYLCYLLTIFLVSLNNEIWLCFWIVAQYSLFFPQVDHMLHYLRRKSCCMFPLKRFLLVFLALW